MSRPPSDTSGSPRYRASAPPPSRLDTRKRNGCLTCRVRRKRCSDTWDETQRAPTYPCMSCQRLKIECLGYFEKRPDWMIDPDIDAVNAIRRGLKQFLRPFHQIPEYYSLSFTELYANDATYVPPFPITARYAWPCNKNPDFAFDNGMEEEEDSGSERGDNLSATYHSQGNVDSVFAALPAAGHGVSRMFGSPGQQSGSAPAVPEAGSMIPTATFAMQNSVTSRGPYFQMAGFTGPSIPMRHEQGSVPHIPATSPNFPWQLADPALPNAGSTLGERIPQRWGYVPQMGLQSSCSYLSSQPDPALRPRAHSDYMIIPNIQPTTFQSQSSVTASACTLNAWDNAPRDYPVGILPHDRTI